MNKFLIILVAAVFLVISALVFNSGDEEATANEPKANNNIVPEKKKGLSEAERDSYANTIKTMNARAIKMQEEQKALLKRMEGYEKNKLKKVT